jgi:tRNA A-37 threonylcarbamoyl transferase component Bud32
VAPSLLDPGTVLGERFAIVGALGSGGTATVYLVVDQLRGERVALKVVHPHLATDPGVQRRVRKEIAAASLLSAEEVLVPHELHELDGLLCLSMPYHPGQTLDEYIASSGPLPLDDVRDLGARVARALESAHRQGLLHRDVTATNVMLERGREARLMDFGLARVEASTTRSTGMLGTTGFAAPEIYDGEPADPRTDLYGLGVVLYLAATGRLPFGSDHAIGTLHLQLSESFPPVRELRPDCPADLATTIERLLRRDREARPSSAGELAAALRDRTSLGADVQTEGRTSHIEPGPWRVVVTEREDDRGRRRVLRVTAGKAPRTLESQVTQQAQRLWTGVLAYIGVKDEQEDAPTPEDLLRRAVVDEAQVDARLRPSPALLQPRFVLVEGVSRQAARRLAADVRTAGFKARTAHTTITGIHPFTWVVALVLAAIVLPALILLPPLGLAFAALALPIAFLPEVARRLVHGQLGELPVAYTAALGPSLDRAVPGRFPLEGPPREAGGRPIPTDSPRPFLSRALASLDALEDTVAQLDLGTVIRSDLARTAKDLRERADLLADALDRLDAELARPQEDHGWVEGRLARLRTKKRAGEAVDDREILELQSLQRTWEGQRALVENLESQRTAATAGLLEIAATATSVRRELLAAPGTEAVQTRSLQRLREEATAARRAQQELARS